MKNLSCWVNKFWRDQNGTAFIELAVVLPVLLLICLGVFEFGNAIFSRHLIENGVRDGARYAAGLPANCGCTADIQNIALKGVLSGGNYRVSWWNPSTTGFVFNVTYPTVPNGPTSCGSTQCYRGPDPLVLVTVSTDIPYQSLGFMGYLGLGTLTMHVQHQERLFGVR